MPDIHYAAIVGVGGTYLAAIGTLTAVAVALRQSHDAQALQSERDEKQRVKDERVQAEKISAWHAGTVDDDYTNHRVELFNHSYEPVFNVVVFTVFIQGAAPRTSESMATQLGQPMQIGDPYRGPNFMRTVLSVLAPGQHHIKIVADTGFHNARIGIEISFTDTRGAHWVRRASGEVEPLSANPIDYYDVERPVTYVMPE